MESFIADFQKRKFCSPALRARTGRGGKHPCLPKPPRPHTELTVLQILRQVAPLVAENTLPRTKNILMKIGLCRTKGLGRRRYTCQPCGEKVTAYNSCGERNCPSCSGRFRSEWLERTAGRIVPGTTYLQLILTVPGEIAEILRKSPRKGYSLLMRTAWLALKKLLERIGIRPAAIMVLHTWNQQLGHHPHVHVLIPAGGVSLDGKRWIRVDNHPWLAPGICRELGIRFRSVMFRRLRWLYKQDRLPIPDSIMHLADATAFRRWLETLAPNGFRVYVQHPPTSSTAPEVILKYLARYISGGPIADGRLVSHENGKVTFMARPGADAPGSDAYWRSPRSQSGSDPLHDKNEQVPITLPEEEFVKRWCMHILPKGFVRVRYYGETSTRHFKIWLARCKELLAWGEQPCLPSPDDELPETRPVDGDSIKPSERQKRCPKCGRPMTCIESEQRPSWREILTGRYRPDWYS